MELAKLLIGRKLIAGFEIGENKISALVLTETKTPGKVKILSYNQEKLEKDVISQGEIKNPQKFILAIKKLYRKAKPRSIKTPWLVLSFPENHIFSLVLSYPTTIPEDQTAEVIRLDAPSFLPWPPDETYLDFQPIFSLKNEKTQEFLVSAAPKKLVDSYIETFKKAGLVIVSLEPASQALVRALKPSSEKPILILNIEDSFSQIVVVEQKTPRFSRIIPQGIHDLENASQKEKFILEIKKVIHFYQAQTGREIKPESIFLASSEKKTKIGQEIAQALSIKVATAIPKLEFEKKIADLPNISLVLIGLAQRGLATQEQKEGISLLPLGAKESYGRELTSAVLRTALNIISLTLFFIIILFSGFWLLLTKLSADLNHRMLTQISQPSQPEIKEIEETAIEFNQRVKLMVNLENQALYWSGVLDEVTAAVPAGVSLTKISYEKEQAPLTLVGLAENREKILEFKKNLQGSDKFTSVTVPISSFEQRENINFAISLVLSPSALKQK